MVRMVEGGPALGEVGAVRDGVVCGDLGDIGGGGMSAGSAAVEPDCLTVDADEVD